MLWYDTGIRPYISKLMGTTRPSRIQTMVQVHVSRPHADTGTTRRLPTAGEGQVPCRVGSNEEQRPGALTRILYLVCWPHRQQQ